MQSHDNGDTRDTHFAARDSDTLARLHAWFDAVVDLPAATREVWIAANVPDTEERAALLRLLSADDSNGGFLDTPAGEHATRLAAESGQVEGLLGQRIGAFRLVRLLGKGGMAAVFLGEREDGEFRQHVAIKLLRRGLYSDVEQRLFLRERQVLANLSHPNIARLFDGGLTEAGVPYLVMEYVDGVPITRHARERRLGVRARLELFLTVCRAVEAAHHALIVHRDIKPSNILIGADGAVKLLDFGIAKLLEDDIENATVGVFTPDYAAPEQIHAGLITTATDVYALGVLLHELLLGTRPVGKPTRRPSSIAAANEDAAVSANLRSSLRGDLDNILLRALAPEPDRRYASAAAFADDIQRHLAGQPVVAHPPSTWYRTRKFIARHRGGVATTLAFLLAIFAALGLALWQANVARHEAQRAISVRDFLQRVFSAAEPAGPRLAPPSVVDIVRTAIVDAQRSTSLHPTVRIELLDTLGRVLGAQGDLEGSAKLLAANYRDASATLGISQPTTLLAGLTLARAMTDAGQRPEARALLDTLLPETERSGDPDLRARMLEASARLGVDRFEQERSLDESARALALCEHDCSEQTRVLVLLARGHVLAGFHHDEAAIPVMEQALALQRKRFDGPHVDIADTLQALSRAHRRSGHLDRAEAFARESLAIVEASVPDPHVRRTDALDTVRQVLIDSHQLDEAATLGLRIVAMDQATLGPQHPGVATSENTLGFTYWQAGRYADAAEHYRAALAVSERIPDNTRRSAIYRANLGFVTGKAGDPKTGISLIQASIDALRGMQDPDYSEICSALEKLGGLQRTSGDLDAALAAFTESDRLYREKLPDAPKTWRVVTLVALGRTHIDRRDDAQAERALQEALATVTTPSATVTPDRIEARAALAGILHRRGDEDGARHLLQQVEQEAQTAHGTLSPGLQQFIESISNSITQQ